MQGGSYNDADYAAHRIQSPQDTDSTFLLSYDFIFLVTASSSTFCCLPHFWSFSTFLAHWVSNLLPEKCMFLRQNLLSNWIFESLRLYILLFLLLLKIYHIFLLIFFYKILLFDQFLLMLPGRGCSKIIWPRWWRDNAECGRAAAGITLIQKWGWNPSCSFKECLDPNLGRHGRGGGGRTGD